MNWLVLSGVTDDDGGFFAPCLCAHMFFRAQHSVLPKGGITGILLHQPAVEACFVIYCELNLTLHDVGGYLKHEVIMVAGGSIYNSLSLILVDLICAEYANIGR